MAARAVSEARPVALVAGDVVLEPGEGPSQLERILDVLARVDFSPTNAAPAPPVDPASCVLVCVEDGAGFGDVLAVGRNAKLHVEEAE